MVSAHYLEKHLPPNGVTKIGFSAPGEQKQWSPPPPKKKKKKVKKPTVRFSVNGTLWLSELNFFRKVKLLYRSGGDVREIRRSGSTDTKSRYSESLQGEFECQRTAGGTMSCVDGRQRPTASILLLLRRSRPAALVHASPFPKFLLLQMDSEFAHAWPHVFDVDASFLLLRDAFYLGYYAMRSVNFPQYYINARDNGRLAIDRYEDTTEFRDKASFALRFRSKRVRSMACLTYCNAMY